MSRPEIDILFEDNHLLVINKPAQLATMGAVAGQPTAAAWAADYLKRKYHKPGNAFVGVVSRLDSFVSGVLVLARTSKAASRLTEQFRSRQTQKFYWAVVEGEFESDIWQTAKLWISKNEALQRMVAVDPKGPIGLAQEASLRWRTLVNCHLQTLIEIELLTGRKHQIRLQLSEMGHPIVGDTKYGARRTFPHGIALHAHRLSIAHPTRGETLTFNAPVPDSWQKLPSAIRRALQ